MSDTMLIMDSPTLEHFERAPELVELLAAVDELVSHAIEAPVQDDALRACIIELLRAARKV